MQFVQLALSLPPVFTKYMPAEQLVQFDDMFPPVLARYVPEEQLMHDVLPLSGW